MSAQPTPGPWHADLHHTRRMGGRDYGFVRAKAIVPVAAVPLGVGGMSEDEGRANARLIAASPDLLEALQNILSLYCTLTSGTDAIAAAARDMAVAAIAKAEPSP